MHQVSVSVLLPVYNGEAHLEEAVQSILSQSFTDFELIIVDDGSVDSSREIAEKIALSDSRVKLISRKNQGLVYTLNEMIDISTGKYLARMDADDISLPDRLKEQYEFLENNQDIGVCGTWYELFGSGQSSKHHPPVTHDLIKASLLFGPVLAHPSVFIRKSVIVDNELKYDPGYLYCEDYKLWIQLIEHTHLATIPKILFKYRVHANQVTEKFETTSLKNRYRVEAEFFARLNMSLNEEEAMILHGRFPVKYQTCVTFNELIKTILKKNEACNYLDQQALEKTIIGHYESVISRKYGVRLFVLYLFNKFSKKSSSAKHNLLIKAMRRSFRNIYNSLFRMERRV